MVFTPLSATRDLAGLRLLLTAPGEQDDVVEALLRAAAANAVRISRAPGTVMSGWKVTYALLVPASAGPQVDSSCQSNGTLGRS